MLSALIRKLSRILNEAEGKVLMPRKSPVPPDSFNEILAWLDPDRERAGCLYEDLRRHLIKIIAWNRCTDPEGMTDETFDRVARKVHELKITYEGDPKLYFYAVANNLIREYKKKINQYVPIEEVDLAGTPPHEEDEVSEMEEQCFRACLQKLSAESRELILAYYAKEKQAKIDHRREMAQRLGVAINTLRVRMFRLRADLEDCIERCLKQLDPLNEMD